MGDVLVAGVVKGVLDRGRSSGRVESGSWLAKGAPDC